MFFVEHVFPFSEIQAQSNSSTSKSKEDNPWGVASFGPNPAQLLLIQSNSASFNSTSPSATPPITSNINTLVQQISDQQANHVSPPVRQSVTSSAEFQPSVTSDQSSPASLVHTMTPLAITRTCRNIPIVDYRQLASLDHTQMIEETEPNTLNQILKSKDWVQAVFKELSALHDNHT